MRIEAVKSDIICEKCGANMVEREGKFGKFLACPNYPECKNIKPVENEPETTCPICGKPVNKRHSKTGKIFYGCSGFPDCKFMSWDSPTGKLCPKCNEHIIVKNIQGKEKIKCSNKDCDYIEE